MAHLLIGDVAERTGLSAPTIRYYESIGLLTRPTRSPSGYRRYSDANLEELGFIKKAQGLGFSLEEISEILKLSREGTTPCAHVLDLARRHLAAVSERIDQLIQFRDQLAGEISKWDRQEQPTCAGLCTIITNSTINPKRTNRRTQEQRR
jgi:MerR family copper efflux transcriptional regulator